MGVFVNSLMFLYICSLFFFLSGCFAFNDTRRYTNLIRKMWRNGFSFFIYAYFKNEHTYKNIHINEKNIYINK